MSELKHCPNCGAPVAPPMNDDDVCYSCGEEITAWYKEDSYEETGMPSDGVMFFIFACLIVSLLAVWFLRQ